MFTTRKIAIIQWLVGIATFIFANVQTDDAIDLIAQELIKNFSKSLRQNIIFIQINIPNIHTLCSGIDQQCPHRTCRAYHKHQDWSLVVAPRPYIFA